MCEPDRFRLWDWECFYILFKVGVLLLIIQPAHQEQTEYPYFISKSQSVVSPYQTPCNKGLSICPGPQDVQHVDGSTWEPSGSGQEGKVIKSILDGAAIKLHPESCR